MEGDFLRSGDIANLLGVSRQRAQRLTREQGFPPPVLELGRTRLWRRSDVEAWERAHASEPEQVEEERTEWSTEITGDVARRLRLLLESILEKSGEALTHDVFAWLRPREKFLDFLATDSYAVVWTRVAAMSAVHAPHAWIAVDPRELVHGLHLATWESTIGFGFVWERALGIRPELRLWRLGEEIRTTRKVSSIDDATTVVTGDGATRSREDLRRSFSDLFNEVAEAEPAEGEAMIGDYGMGFLELWWHALRHAEIASDIRVKVTGPGSHILVSAHHGEDLAFQGIFMAMPGEES